MLFAPRLVLGSVLVAGALFQNSAPVLAAGRAPNLAVSAAKIDFAEDALETRWSSRAAANFAGDGAISVIFGWKDAKNFACLQLQRADGKTLAQLEQTRAGIRQNLTLPLAIPAARGEIGVQKFGALVRVLWNGQALAQTPITLSGARFGTWASGAAHVVAPAPQPTEAVVFRDDFMRAQGPEQSEIPGEWTVAGVWKTSGTLGPKSDAALNPNPFVFRAQGLGENVARAGKWWWNDYSLSASVRASRGANSRGEDSKGNLPLRAALEAFAPQNGGGIRAEIDFARGIAVLKSSDKILAQSPCDAETEQWHRVRLDPGPGIAKLWIDGVLVLQAPARLAQGGVALRATSAPGASVDFDDVRVGQATGNEWGEGALPERFQKDRLMSQWASSAKSWTRDGNGIWWHSGDFFGAASVEVPRKMLGVGEGLALRLRADPKNLSSGAKLVISRPTPSKILFFALWEDGQLRSQKAMEIGAGEQLSALRLRYVPGKKTEFRLGVEMGQNFSNFIFAGKVGTEHAGVKIGVEPLRNGKPLAAAALQAVSIKSATFSRENRAVIGVNITPVTPEIARRIGLPDALGAVVDHVEEDAPAFESGIREGDVIRGVDGARVADVASMRAAVGAVKAGTVVQLAILRPQSDASGLDWSKCAASTPQMLDYSFTTAPTDWRAARGTWEVAERWTCSPQWSFFAGQNDAAPLLWSRFATQGDWTLEAYLATPMDLGRGERSPSDLNIGVGGDGVDLASGYSFIFGGNNRSVNQIRRGDDVALEKPFEMPPGAGDVHQDWFYVRLERRQTARGVRFKYLVNGREIADYTDKNPLADGGHIGFWTQNGALSVARVRLWHSGLRQPKPNTMAPSFAFSTPSKPIANDLGIWSARGQNSEASARLISLSPTGAQGKKTVQITNPHSGGDWTTYVTRRPFSRLKHPALSWDYRVPGGVKINLYAQIGGSWREIGFTGGLTPGQDEHQLGQVPGVVADGNWHRARFDLSVAFKRRGIEATEVQALAFAAPDQGYLRAGLGGNHQGATYWLRGFGAS